MSEDLKRFSRHSLSAHLKRSEGNVIWPYPASPGHRRTWACTKAPEGHFICRSLWARWEAGGSAVFDQLIQKLYGLYRWQSFAVSDNSSLVLGERNDARQS